MAVLRWNRPMSYPAFKLPVHFEYEYQRSAAIPLRLAKLSQLPPESRKNVNDCAPEVTCAAVRTQSCAMTTPEAAKLPPLSVPEIWPTLLYGVELARLM